MDIVPPDLLAIMFRFCILKPNPVSFRVLALVSRRWHEAVWRYFISSRNIRLTEKGEAELDSHFTCLKHVTSLELSSAIPSLLSHLIHAAPKLVTLRLWRGGLSEDAVTQLEKLASLRHVRCEFFPSPAWRDAELKQTSPCGALSKLSHLQSLETVITSDSAMAELRKLQSLVVRGSGSLTSQGLIAMGPVLALRTLILSDCLAITDDGMESVAQGARETLESVDVSMCALLTDRTLDALALCSNLQVLRASFCKKMHGTGVQSLHNCSRLTSLDLSYMGHADPGMLLYIARMYSLTHLDLSRVRGVTVAGLAAVAESLHSLQNYRLFLDATFEGEALQQVYFPHNLKSLSLGASHITSLPPRISYLTQLRSLNLESLARLTSRGLAPVSKCTGLTWLKLDNCVQLADVALVHLRTLTQLRFLDVHYCHGLSQRAVQTDVPRTARVVGNEGLLPVPPGAPGPLLPMPAAVPAAALPAMLPPGEEDNDFEPRRPVLLPRRQ